MRTITTVLTLLAVALALAQRPVPSALAYPTWAEAHIQGIVARVAQPRTTVYYVDARFGRDTNDGLSPRRPWRSLAQVRQALGTRVDDVEVRFRRGQTWRDPLGLSTVQVATRTTFSSYGEGPLPHITTSSLVDFRMASMKSSVLSRVWRPFAPQVVAEAGDLVDPYRRVSSLEDVRRTPGTWLHSRSTLYVNPRRLPGRTSRSRVQFELFPKSDVSGFELQPGSDEVLVDGLGISGYGADVDVPLPKYAVKGNLTGAGTLVVRDCTLAYNGKHNVGNTSPTTGGVLVVLDSRVGWVTGGHSLFVHYAGQGGNEGYALRVAFTGGQAPEPVLTTGAGSGLGRVNATYAHTNTGQTGYHLVKDCVVRPHLFQATDFGGAADSPDFAEDLARCVNVLIGNRYLAHAPTADELAGIVVPWVFGQQPAAIRQGASGPGRRTAFFANNLWEVRPLWFRDSRGFGRGIVDRIEGLHVNSLFLVDLTHARASSPAPTDMGLVPYGENLGASFHHCHLWWGTVRPFQVGAIAQLLADRTLGRFSPSDFHLVGSIVTGDSADAGLLSLGAGNNLTPHGILATPPYIAGLVHNLGLAGQGTDWIGTGRIDGRFLPTGWSPQRRPSAGSLDVAPTLLPGGYRLEYDFSGMPRRTTSTSAGPFEALD